MHEDEIERILNEILLPSRLSKELSWNAIHFAERKLSTFKKEGHDSEIEVFDPSFFEEVKKASLHWTKKAKNYTKLAVLVPTSYIGITKGLSFPDVDISLLGIGNHRFFLFHGGFAVWVLSKLYKAYQARGTNRTTIADRTVQKILGVLVGSTAFGVGIHLFIDVFQPKSIVFPFFGSLVDGTMVDDNIWLLANSIWCFRIGKDVMALALGSDLDKVKRYVYETFVRPLSEGVRK